MKVQLQVRKANAWATILGAPIIWGCLWALGYQLIPPETFGATIGIAGICLVAAWVAIFVIQFVSAPPRLYTKLKRELDWLKGARKPELRVTRFYPKKRSVHVFLVC
jgi:hypothetical protein